MRCILTQIIIIPEKTNLKTLKPKIIIHLKNNLNFLKTYVNAKCIARTAANMHIYFFSKE